jgi:hypothetical protein
MPAIIVDSGPVPILVRGRSEARVALVSSASSGSAMTITAGTVTLYSAAGVSLVSASISGASATYTVPAGNPGRGYEVWAVTAGGSAVTFRVGVLLGTYDLACPIVDDDITQRYPALGTYPAGETSWYKAINRGWDRLLRDLMTTSRIGLDAEVMYPDVLREAALASCMAQIMGIASTYGAQPWADLEQKWEQRYDHQMERLILTYGTDSDTVPDTGPTRLGRGSGIGEVNIGRKG